MLVLLTNTIVEDLNDPPVIRYMKQVLHSELKGRQQSEDEDLLLMATILNPFTMGLSFPPEEQQINAQKLLLDEVKIIVTTPM